MYTLCKDSSVRVVQKSSTMQNMEKGTGMEKEPGVDLARLNQLMKEKSWGIGELAQYSGVKYDTVYSLVKGRRPNNSVVTIKKIADALETSVSYLLGENDNKNVPTKPLPEPIRQLAQIASNLSKVRQEELIRIAKALAEMEREHAQRPLSEAAVRALTELSEELRGNGENEDLLALLQDLLRNPPPRWLIDL
jgi:transcriptional regulator with XRE-family HTH domain